MTTLDELKAKHAKEIEQQQRCDAITALLPLPADMVIVHSGNRPHAYYNATSLEQALDILGKFEPAPFVQVRGTFLSHKPREWFKTEDLERATSIVEAQAGGVVLTIGGGPGFGPDAKLVIWAKLSNGELCEVHVSLGVYPSGKGFPQKWRVASSVEYDRHGDIIRAEHRPPSICADLPSIRWGAGSRDAYSFSWVWLERDTFNNEMARYVEANIE